MAFPVPPKLAALYRPKSMSRQLSVSMSLTNKGLLNPTGENNCFLNSTVQVSVRIELLLLTVLLPFTAFLSHLTSCPSLFPKTLPSLLLPPTCFSPSLFLVFCLPPYTISPPLSLCLPSSLLLSSLPFTSSSHPFLFSPLIFFSSSSASSLPLLSLYSLLLFSLPFPLLSLPFPSPSPSTIAPSPSTIAPSPIPLYFLLFLSLSSPSISSLPLPSLLCATEY